MLLTSFLLHEQDRRRFESDAISLVTLFEQCLGCTETAKTLAVLTVKTDGNAIVPKFDRQPSSSR